MRFFKKKLFELNKKFIKELIGKFGNGLFYLSKEQKDDKEIVLLAVKRNGLAIKFASKRLRGDKEIILEAVKQKANLFNQPFKFVSSEIKSDFKFAFDVLKLNEG